VVRSWEDAAEACARGVSTTTGVAELSELAEKYFLRLHHEPVFAVGCNMKQIVHLFWLLMHVHYAFAVH